MLNLSKYRSRSKNKRPPKLSKRRKPIARRSKFKVCDNPAKPVRRRFTDYQVSIRGEIARQARKDKATEAEKSFEALLVSLGVAFTREAFFQNGDRFILADFYIINKHLVIEIDGSAHNSQKGYDEGRTKWLETKGIKIVRFSNKAVLKTPEVVETLVKNLLH